MGARFSVLILKGAQKDLLGLPPAIRLQILAKIKSLKTRPLPTGKSDIKILHGFRPVLFRLRSGDFRVVYRLKEKVVEVVAVVNRKAIETMLRRLRQTKPVPRLTPLHRQSFSKKAIKPKA